jgi:hypothetical protein
MRLLPCGGPGVMLILTYVKLNITKVKKRGNKNIFIPDKMRKNEMSPFLTINLKMPRDTGFWILVTGKFSKVFYQVSRDQYPASVRLA